MLTDTLLLLMYMVGAAVTMFIFYLAYLFYITVQNTRRFKRVLKTLGGSE